MALLNYPVELKVSEWTKKKGKTVPGGELTRALQDLEKCFKELKTTASEKRYAALSAQASGVAATAMRTHDRCLESIHRATKEVCLAIAGKARDFKKVVDSALAKHEAYIEKQAAAIEVINRNLTKMLAATKATMNKVARFVETAKRGPGANEARKKAAAGQLVKLVEGHAATVRKEYGKVNLIATSYDSIDKSYTGVVDSCEKMFKEVLELTAEGKKALKPYA